MRVLVTGANGFIGAKTCELLARSGHTLLRGVRTSTSDHDVVLDLATPHTISRALDAAAPEAVIHTAAMRDLAQCEREPDLAHRVNVLATQVLSQWAGERGARLIFCSTDQVFDGRRGWYSEHDAPCPINTYGKGKAKGEELVLHHAWKTGTVARVTLTLGHTRERDRATNEFVVKALRAGQPARMYVQEYRSPILVDDCAHSLVQMLPLSGLRVLNVCGPERVNRLELGQAIAARFGLDASLCVPVLHDAASSGLNRPLECSLDPTLHRAVLHTPARGVREALLALDAPL